MGMINNKQSGRSILVALVACFLWGLHSVTAQAQPSFELDAFALQDSALLSSRDYAALEKRLRPYLDSYASNKITAAELADRFEVFTLMNRVEPRLDEWVQSMPNSYTARLARGIYHVTDAWNKRGKLVRSRTSDEQMRGFQESLTKSRADLLASIPLYVRPVNSYRYLVRVSKGLGLDDERALLDAALKLDPKAYDIRSEYYDAITPNWGGSERMLAKFVEECQNSPMSDKDKKRIAGIKYYELAQQARENKDIKAGSDYFYQYYLSNQLPNVLLWSAQVALEGKLQDLAIERLNELNKQHPAYPYGFELRAQLYEYHYKDINKAIQDYLSAANGGASWSQNHIGWYYMKGINVPVDYVKAKHYLELAAKQGDRNAMANLDMLKKIKTGE
jgi:Domain of unknown function (DUF4034)